MRAKFLRFLVPITPLWLVTLVLMLIGGHSLFQSFTEQPEYAIYPAVFLVLFGVAVMLYFIERRLLQHFAYLKIVLTEVLLGVTLYLGISYNNATTQIHFNTDRDYILVLFDRPDSLAMEFESNGLFSKILTVNQGNVAHLNTALAKSSDLQIIEPAHWEGVYYQSGTFTRLGIDLNYIYCFNEKRNPIPANDNYLKTLPKYVDSLIDLEFKRYEGQLLAVGILQRWPAEIEGCSCYFSFNWDGFEQEEYIFVSDSIGDTAFMQLNGQETRITGVASMHENADGQLRQVWSGPGVSITLELKQVSQLDETWQYEGRLILTSNAGALQEFPVYGECGC
jgi:hypothetical protein